MIVYRCQFDGMESISFTLPGGFAIPDDSWRSDSGFPEPDRREKVAEMVWKPVKHEQKNETESQQLVYWFEETEISSIIVEIISID